MLVALVKIFVSALCSCSVNKFKFKLVGKQLFMIAIESCNLIQSSKKRPERFTFCQMNVESALI